MVVVLGSTMLQEMESDPVDYSNMASMWRLNISDLGLQVSRADYDSEPVFSTVTVVVSVQ